MMFRYTVVSIPVGCMLLSLVACMTNRGISNMRKAERQVTKRNQGHVLTNIGVWTPDSKWLIYDLRVRDDVFDGGRIERVNVENGDVELLYQSSRGACCGVVTCSPVEDKVVFIHAPENPTSNWQYSAFHRYGVLVDLNRPGRGTVLDARDLCAPLTPGALRGGTHVHVFSGDGQWVSFTYEDALLADNNQETDNQHLNLRNVGVAVPARAVKVGGGHPRNHDGAFFSVLISKTVASPEPGSDQISRAFSDAWVGKDGYVKPDGSRQKKALAFQGNVVDAAGTTISEVFIADLPDDLTTAKSGFPLEGTVQTRPNPPAGVAQRRLTFTAGRKYPGLRGARHWPRSSPDGSQIAFLMKDDEGVVQLWTIAPNGGDPSQITRNKWDAHSAFSWSPDGERIAYIMDNSVFVTDVAGGASRRITERRDDKNAPTRHCCAFSPDGTKIAFMRPDAHNDDGRCQLFVVAIGK